MPESRHAGTRIISFAEGSTCPNFWLWTNYGQSEGNSRLARTEQSTRWTSMGAMAICTKPQARQGYASVAFG